MFGNRSENNGEQTVIEDHQRSENGKLLLHGIRQQVTPKKHTLILQIYLGLEDYFVTLFVLSIRSNSMIRINCVAPFRVVSKRGFFNLNHLHLIRRFIQDGILWNRFRSYNLLFVRIPFRRNESGNDSLIGKAG